MKAGHQLNFKKTNDHKQNKLKKTVKFRDSIARSQRNSVKFDNDDESDEDIGGDVVNSVEIKSDVDATSSSKRAINYQIEKNKGLTPKRDKTYRNPRVRNRMKARKAIIKRKSIVPKVRTQETRYSGEATGIRSGIVRAVKIK